MNKFISKLNSKKLISVFLLFTFYFSLSTYLVFATTPDPGHPWTEVGDGTFIVTGPTSARTYTFPDTNTTVLADAATLSVIYGGTGLTTYTAGDFLYASASNTLSVLAKDTNSTRYLSNTGTSNNPAWAQIDLTNGVTGILPSANGGTANDYTKFTGALASEKTYTLPNASATILTDNAAVTFAQGGSGASLSASNGGIFYSGSSVGAILSGTATANKMLMSGASTAPVWSTPVYPNASATSGKIIISDGTNFIASTPTYPNSATTSGQQLVTDGTNVVAVDIINNDYIRGAGGSGQNREPLHFEANLTATTSLANNGTMFIYAGRAAKAYTSCDLRTNVTTAFIAGTGSPWAEVGIFEGALPGFGNNASITARSGTTDVSTTFNSTGLKTTTVSVSGIAQGDDLWVAYAASQGTGGTRYQVRGDLADDLQLGTLQTATSTRPSTVGLPVSPTIGAATLVPARFTLKCT